MALGRIGTDDRATAEYEIGTHHPQVLVDEEVFLLDTERRGHTLYAIARTEDLEQPHRMCIQGFDRANSGVFWSSDSPVQDTKQVGMHRVDSPPLRVMNAGLVGSHAVYPRASKVSRMPPEGMNLHPAHRGSDCCRQLGQHSTLAVEVQE